MLICLEASAEDAARTAWTTDVRYVRGYDESDPRPVPARTLDAALARRAHGRVGLELSLGTQASDRMVGEPTTFTKAWFDAFARRRRRDAAARARAHDQDGAGDRAPADRERDRRAGDAPRAPAARARHEGVRGRRALAGLRARRRARPATTSSSRCPFSLVWAGKGIKTFTATADLPVVEGEPVLFEIWVCADGYWADHTKNLVVGELKPEYAELEEQLMAVYAAALQPRARRGSRWPTSTGASARDSPAWAIRDSRRIRSATGSARARTSRPTRTRPRGGTFEENMVLAVEPGVYWEGGGGLRVEDNFLVTRGRAREAVGVPGRGRALLTRRDLDRRAERRVPRRRQRRAVRHDAPRRRADRRRRARPRAEARDRAAARRARRSTGSRPASRASRRTTGTR